MIGQATILLRIFQPRKSHLNFPALCLLCLAAQAALSPPPGLTSWHRNNLMLRKALEASRAWRENLDRAIPGEAHLTPEMRIEADRFSQYLR